MSLYYGRFSSDVTFYASVLSSCAVLNFSRNENDHFGLDEPLFYNSFLGDNICTSNTIVKTYMDKI